jgi:hypothetical protein
VLPCDFYVIVRDECCHLLARYSKGGSFKCRFISTCMCFTLSFVFYISIDPNFIMYSYIFPFNINPFIILAVKSPLMLQ